MEKSKTNWTKSIGIPMEFALSIIIFSIIGYLIGKHLFDEIGSVIGIILGVIFGFFSALKYLTELF